MSLEDDIARQAFHVEQLEKGYTAARRMWLTAKENKNWAIAIEFKRTMQDLYLRAAEANKDLRQMCMQLPLSLPPDPRWGR